MTLISIIVPVYNVSTYIEACFASIINQTYRQLEIIFVTDKPTDNSEIILRKLSQDDDRIKIISHKNNKGLLQARLTGLREAHGDFITFVDSDDIISLDMCEKLLNKAKMDNSQIVAGGYMAKIENTGKEIYNQASYVENLSFKSNQNNSLLKALLNSQISHNIWGKLYSKDLFPENGYIFGITDKINTGEDLLFTSYLYSKADSYSEITDAIYIYAIRGGSLTNTFNLEAQNKRIIDIYNVLYHIKEYLHKKELWNDVLYSYKDIQSDQISYLISILLRVRIDKIDQQEALKQILEKFGSAIFYGGIYNNPIFKISQKLLSYISFVPQFKNKDTLQKDLNKILYLKAPLDVKETLFSDYVKLYGTTVSIKKLYHSRLFKFSIFIERIILPPNSKRRYLIRNLYRKYASKK